MAVLVGKKAPVFITGAVVNGNEIVDKFSFDVPHGYNDWRVPTIEEMALIKANKTKITGIGNGEYMTSDGQHSGILRLVTTGKAFAVVTKRKIAETEQKRFAEEQRKANEQRQAEEARIMASLSTFEAARFYMLRTYGKDINYINSSKETTGHSGWFYVDHRQLSNIPAMQKLLETHRFWWGHQEVNNYSNQPIPCINHKKGHSLPGWTNISVYSSQSRSYTTQRMVFASRTEVTDCQLPNDVVFMNECQYADLYYRQLNSTEATRLAEQIVITAAEKFKKTEEASRAEEQARILAEQKKIEEERKAKETRLVEEERKNMGNC